MSPQEGFFRRGQSSSSVLNNRGNRTNYEEEEIEPLKSKIIVSNDYLHFFSIEKLAVSWHVTCIVALILSILAIWQYMLSLRGGTLEWLNANAAQLVFQLLSSVFLYYMAIFILLLWPTLQSGRSAKIGKRCTIIIIMFSILIIINYDSGADFEHHGSFNSLLFRLVGIPLGFLFAAMILLFKKIGVRRGLVLIMISASFILFVIAVRSAAGRKAWGYGLHGRHIDDDLVSVLGDEKYQEAHCRLIRPSSLDIPWPSVLSVKSLLDYAFGRDECTQVNRFSAVEDGRLIMTCPSPKLRSTTPSNEIPDECKGRKISVRNVTEWPLELCLPKGTNSDVKKTEGKSNVGWFTTHAHVLEQFPLWDDIPPNVRTGLKTPESYARKLTVGRVPSSNPPKKKYFIDLPADFASSGGLLSTQCPYAEDKNLLLVPPTPPSSSKCHGEQMNKMDISLILIDALGRPHAHRKLPNTMKALETLTEPARLGSSPWLDPTDQNIYSFEFFRFHSIGFNTGPNSGALFTGEAAPDDSMTNLKKEHKIESEKMIWNILKKASDGKRITAMVHEICQHWASTYAQNESNLDHEVYLPFCAHETFPHPTPFGSFQGPFSFRKRCLNGKEVHEHTIEWLEEFMASHNRDGIPWFHLLWMLEAHESTGELISTVDKRLAQFLLEFMTSPESYQNSCLQTDSVKEQSILSEIDNAFNHTLQFLFADHGLHMGPFAQFSRLGKTENLLPSLFITVPAWFLRKYPDAAQALTINQYRLVSNYDFYSGLESLRHLPEFKTTKTGEVEKKRTGLDGIFKTQDANRSCRDARVPDIYCACSSNPSF